MSSDTPRTDENECEAITGLGRCVGVNFARQLERELNATREELQKERARLDWLERQGKGKFSPLWVQDWIHIRSAIDAAMKEDAK